MQQAVVLDLMGSSGLHCIDCPCRAANSCACSMVPGGDCGAVMQLMSVLAEEQTIHQFSCIHGCRPVYILLANLLPTQHVRDLPQTLYSTL